MASSLATLDALLDRREPLDVHECLTLVDGLSEAPGRSRRVVERLAGQRDAAAVEALLRLPAGTAGVVEGVFAALRRGVARHGPRMLAIEFRRSDARRFGPVLERAELAFGNELEHLQLGSASIYRIALLESAARGRVVESAARGRVVESARGNLRRRARASALDLEVLHRSLLRLRGVRVWINGWRLDDHSPLRPPARVPLLRAWLDWANDEQPD